MFDEMGELLARLYDLDRETHEAITDRFCCVESSILDKYDDIYEKIVQGCIQDACVRKEWDFHVEMHIIYTDEDTKTNIREAIIQDSIQRACDTHSPRLFWFLSNDVLKEKIEYCADICVTDMLKELSSEKGDSAAIALLKAYVSALGEIENERVDGKSK